MRLVLFFVLIFHHCNAAPIEVNEHTPCPSLPDIAHGRKVFVKDPSWEEEDICRVHFICDHGYQIKGNADIYCFYGVWTGDVPECTSNPCSTLLAPTNGRVTFVGPIEPYLTHSIAEVTCNDDYLIEDNQDNVLICKEAGVWSAEVPACVEYTCDSTGEEEVVSIPDSTISPDSHCYSNPCLNGGTCTDSDDYYVCTCPQHYNGHDCEHATGNTCEPDEIYAHCGLGMTDGRIENSQITASDYFSTDYPWTARLTEKYYGWEVTDTGPGHWIQVTFASSVVISGLMMRGDGNGYYWITTFNVQYADEGGNLQYIKDSNDIKTFAGNTDDTLLTVLFDENITTSTIRILPITWHSSRIALRMELLTPTDLNSEEGKNLPSDALCRFKRSDVAVDSETCSSYNGDCGIGMADGRITNNQITAVNYYSISYPYYARLNLYSSGWMAEEGTSNAWIQIAVTKAMDMSGVMTLGYEHCSRWVTAFKIQYGNSTNALTTIQDEDGDKLFPGNWDRTSTRTTFFDSIITAKYLRLVVISGNMNLDDYAACLRMEILTPTNLMSEEARALPANAVCQYESYRFIIDSSGQAIIVV